MNDFALLTAALQQVGHTGQIIRAAAEQHARAAQLHLEATQRMIEAAGRLR